MKNVTKIIVITGKGLRSKNVENPYLSKDLSILKYSVPEFIENNKSLTQLLLKPQMLRLKMVVVELFISILKIRINLKNKFR